MKITDLMVGDWVYIKEYPSIAQPMQVKKEHFIRSLVEFEPIPLTKEILDKNGFWGEVYSWINVGDEKTLEYYPLEHRLSLWYGEGKNQELLFRCQCFYVHELQHALKLCKIEKEIIL